MKPVLSSFDVSASSPRTSRRLMLGLIVAMAAQAAEAAGLYRREG